MSPRGGFEVKLKLPKTFDLLTFSKKTFRIKVIVFKEGYGGMTFTLTLRGHLSRSNEGRITCRQWSSYF